MSDAEALNAPSLPHPGRTGAALAQLADDGCPHDGRRRHHKRPAAARFWTYHRGGYVRLSLRPGEQLRHETGGPTDEGYHGEASIYTHAGDDIALDWATWGRDCDGRTESYGASFAPLATLTARDAFDLTNGASEARGIRLPVWNRGRTRNRDHAAEAAGY